MTVDPQWIRSEVDRKAIAEGCYFDEAAGLRACEFIETFCRHSKGRWAGKPIVLLDWERDAVMRLFGWKKANGLRRYRSFYLEIGKKNGKSTLVSAIALYLLVADGEGAPEIYLNACDVKQARIVFDGSASMVRSSPELALRLKVMSSLRIVDPKGEGYAVANSSVVDAKDGFNPHGIIFDEVHRQRDRLLFDVFEHAAIAREQPLYIYITTAGEDDLGIWHELRELSERTNSPAGDDTSHLGIVYRAQPEDDIDSPDTWRKANPSLGHTIKEEEFARDLKAAKEQPAKLANFKRLRLNIIAAGEGKFVDMDAWDRCNADPGSMAGRVTYAGLDLSSRVDLTALAFIFGSDPEGWGAILRFWLPEENIDALAKRDRVQYRLWEEKGFLVATPGNIIDYEFIKQEIIELASIGEMRRLCADPHMATQLLTELHESHGLPVEPIQQGFISMNEPTKALHASVVGKKLRHGGNPILRWNATNAVVLEDARRNWKIDKKKSNKKIDGLAALVNAFAASIGEVDTGESVYNTSPLMVIGGRRR